MVDDDEAARRRHERGERAAAHRAARDRVAAAESVRAQELVRAFAAEARRRGLPTQRLTARPWRGRARYPTDVEGWYLRLDQSQGVGIDGGYHVLVVAPRRLGRWRTLRLTATPPPLRVGEGARDGESFALEDLLALRLDRGNAR